MISVALPVGPSAANKRWLGEALDSIAAQTVRPEEIVIVDDGAGIGHSDICRACPNCHLGPWRADEVYSDKVHEFGGLMIEARDRPIIRIWRPPWRMGVAHAYNCAVGLARTELVFLMGSDDHIEADCLERCLDSWQANGRADAFYWVGVRYLDGRADDVQHLPCNAAMVTKGLWRYTGGFPPETASGASDAALISMLLAKRPDLLVEVAPARTLYNYRAHQGTDTANRGSWQGVILETRNLLTDQWRPR